MSALEDLRLNIHVHGRITVGRKTVQQRIDFGLDRCRIDRRCFGIVRSMLSW